jgi:hypothetical protein
MTEEKKEKLYKINMTDSKPKLADDDFGFEHKDYTSDSYTSVSVGKPKGYVPPQKPVKPEGMALMGGGSITKKDWTNKLMRIKKEK